MKNSGYQENKPFEILESTGYFSVMTPYIKTEFFHPLAVVEKYIALDGESYMNKDRVNKY